MLGHDGSGNVGVTVDVDIEIEAQKACNSNLVDKLTGKARRTSTSSEPHGSSHERRKLENRDRRWLRAEDSEDRGIKGSPQA